MNIPMQCPAARQEGFVFSRVISCLAIRGKEQHHDGVWDEKVDASFSTCDRERRATVRQLLQRHHQCTGPEQLAHQPLRA